MFVPKWSIFVSLRWAALHMTLAIYVNGFVLLGMNGIFGLIDLHCLTVFTCLVLWRFDCLE